MTKKNKKNRVFLIIILILVGFIISTFLILKQTNFIYKNTDFEIKINLDNDVENNKGYLIITRNEKTPSVSDWVVFDNNESIKFFSEEDFKTKLFVKLPTIIESGTYYFDVEVNYVDSNNKEILEFDFKVI